MSPLERATAVAWALPPEAVLPGSVGMIRAALERAQQLEVSLGTSQAALASKQAELDACEASRAAAKSDCESIRNGLTTLLPTSLLTTLDAVIAELT